MKTSKGSYLCESCVEKVDLLDPNSRCCYCFKEGCLLCSSGGKRAALFSSFDPMTALIKGIEGVMPSFYYQIFISYAVIQIDRLQWPAFSSVTPLSFFSGSRWLAKELSKVLGREKNQPVLYLTDRMPDKNNSSISEKEYLLSYYTD
jgi:hypothetical protein